MKEQNGGNIPTIDSIAEAKCRGKKVKISGSLATAVANMLNEIYQEDDETVSNKRGLFTLESFKDSEIVTKIKDDISSGSSADAFLLTTGGVMGNAQDMYECAVAASDEHGEDMYLVSAHDFTSDMDHLPKEKRQEIITDYIKYRQSAEDYVLSNGGHVYRLYFGGDYSG